MLLRITCGAVAYALLKFTTTVSPSAHVLAKVNSPATSVDAASIAHVPLPAVVTVKVGTVPSCLRWSACV